MLKNFWYAVELSSDITSKPKGITVLGQQFALYRNSEGRVVALSDLCVHRGGALSDGWVEGDCIRCPYHGWKYQADGACIEIPANQPGALIPKKARVDVYPVQEKYGWVWLFLGDLFAEERPPLPPLPEFGDPVWRSIYGEFKWNAHYTRVVENGIDIAHTPFVHATSFGNKDEPQIEEYKVRLSDWGGSASVNLKPPSARGLWKYIRHKDQPAVKVAVAFYMPNVTRLDVDLGDSRLIIFAAHVPINDNTTITKWIQLRNFFTHPWADGDAQRRTLKIFKEDRRLVEAQRPELLPYDLAAELHVHSDALQIAYRRLRNKCLDRGWGIDTAIIKSAYSSHQAVVIPSPARHQTPELAKAWVRERADGGRVCTRMG